MLSRIHAAVGVVESVDDEHLRPGHRRRHRSRSIAVYIGMLGLDFHVDGPPALLTHLETIGTRYLNAIR